MRPVAEADWEWADIVLLSGMIVQKAHLLSLLADARRRRKPVVVGGPVRDGAARRIAPGGSRLPRARRGRAHAAAIPRGAVARRHRRARSPPTAQSPISPRRRSRASICWTWTPTTRCTSSSRAAARFSASSATSSCCTVACREPSEPAQVLAETGAAPRARLARHGLRRGRQLRREQEARPRRCCASSRGGRRRTTCHSASTPRRRSTWRRTASCWTSWSAATSGRCSWASRRRTRRASSGRSSIRTFASRSRRRLTPSPPPASA